MLRSMYSGISGLRGFQTKLDVIGNNIANVNTFGFKKGRVTFKDMINQQVQGASSPQQNRGGTNPRQVGLGSQLGSIDTIHTPGNTQTTSRPLDLAVSGEGFFIVNDGQLSYYTRAGNFYLDQEGNLVNADGLYVQGYPAEDGEVDTDAALTNLRVTSREDAEIESFDISQSGEITAIYTNGDIEVLGQIALATFNNPEGLSKAGDNLYLVSNNSGEADIRIAGETAGAIIGGTLEMSNVDLAEEFTEMIVAQRGFQANTRIITTSDEILQELVNLKR
ncbi:MAG TPA: flagellar basal body rod protein FlgG [Pseudogracilibacillus sp.]|nr:flagellar basal body rod protein FlgG [Pseudogracilibacillus sp.]